MNTFVLGFSGRIASGKSTLSVALAESLNFNRVSFGDYVRHLAEYMGLNTNDRSVLQDIGRLLAQHPREFCAKVLAQVEYQAGQPLVVDGIRHVEIADELRIQVAPAELKLIFVEADKETIGTRLSQTGKSCDDIRHFELDPTEAQAQTTLPRIADIRIHNNISRSPEEALNQIMQWLEYSERGDL